MAAGERKQNKINVSNNPWTILHTQTQKPEFNRYSDITEPWTAFAFSENVFELFFIKPLRDITE